MRNGGGHSTRQFSDTHEIAHHITLPGFTTHDGIHSLLTYMATEDQD